MEKNKKNAFFVLTFWEGCHINHLADALKR